MGGAPPIHLTMAIYAGIVYYKICQHITCKEEDTRLSVLIYLDDILFIFIAHMICAVLWIVKKALKS